MWTVVKTSENRGEAVARPRSAAAGADSFPSSGWAAWALNNARSFFVLAYAIETELRHFDALLDRGADPGRGPPVTLTDHVQGAPEGQAASR